MILVISVAFHFKNFKKKKRTVEVYKSGQNNILLNTATPSNSYENHFMLEQPNFLNIFPS